MSEGVQPVATGDTDATTVIPTGRKRSQFAPALERPAARADVAHLGGLNPLVEAANPLLAAVPQIRHALRHPDPAALRARLRDQVARFERSAKTAGVAEERIFVARYALCALLDDAAAATPWGSDWMNHGLLAELHGERSGAEKFFTLLEQMALEAATYLELFEFFYVCLALGFEGKYRSGEGGRQALAQLRTQTYRALSQHRAAAPAELSARWQSAARRHSSAAGAVKRFVSRWSMGALAWVAIKENERLLDGIAGGDKRMQDAVRELRKARFRGPTGERRTVAELPWYVLIGAPGSGKTTALLNAGLRFPLGMPGGERAVHGVGGTRNCDWWFTDEAVLLDTAGRYTTQESDSEADAAAWLGFLELLKAHRQRQPLNGVIVTVSLADLVHWSTAEMAAYAEHVRRRISELTSRLRVRLPVYVLVTKADLLAGFMEFFGDLDADGRAQVWGMTFSGSQAVSDPAAHFEEEFGHLERRLYGMLPGKLHEERDLQRRAAIYRFPQQFRAIGPLTRAFMESAFGAGAPADATLLRGVYFASGTQEGSPIDRVMATLARSFNLERKVQPPNLGGGKSFFLRRLLHDVIFAEADLGGTCPSPSKS